MTTYVSLFAGAGGWDLGCDAAGWECVAQIENDPHCIGILQRHWPDVPRWGDVSDVHGADLPAADVICFGSPCTDLSIAGNRSGINGTDSGLFFEAIRIIKEMRRATGDALPRCAVWENVRGALSTHDGRDFGAVLDSLADVGAVAVEWRIVDGVAFGPPQRRTRVFVVAQFDPRAVGGPEVFAESESVRRDPETSRNTGPVTAALTSNGVGTCGADDNQGQAGHLIPWNQSGPGYWLEGVGPLRARDSKGDTTIVTNEGTEDIPPVAGTLGGNGNGGPRTDPERMTFVPTYANSLTARDNKGIPTYLDAGQFNVVPFNATQITHAVNRSNPQPGDPNGTLDTDARSAIAYSITPLFGQGAELQAVETDVVNTLTGINGQDHDRGTRIADDVGVRRLTPRECERLQGFPDDHTLLRADGTVVADGQRYRMLGNAVMAPMGEWVARRIEAVL